MKRVGSGLVLVLALVAGCSGGGAGPAPTTADPGTSRPGPTTPPATAAPAPDTDWYTYHRDPGRSGLAPGVPPLTNLRLSWRARLDGAVYGQPLVIGDRVVAATENNTIYALNRASGRVRWSRHLGPPVRRADLPCGNIDPLGITGTPVYDPATQRVYAVAETTGFRHVLYGVAVADGAVQVSREVPTPDGQPRFDQQRPALLLANGRVYVAFGGLNGDCGPYIGSVVGVPTSGSGPLVSYRVPTSREGGIWATGGPTLGPDGRIYVSAGNGAASSGRYDGSDSVVALDADLHQQSVFAPTTWAEENAKDLDLGSMAPAVLPGNRVFIAGKARTGYLLRTPDLGGVGGQLAESRVCAAFGGPAHDGSTVYVPCWRGGLAAVSVAGDRIRVRWRGPDNANGSPVIGGGAVWVASWTDGTLYALDPKTGRPRKTIEVGEELPHFVSPTLSGNLVLLGTMHGVVAVSGA